MIKHGIIVVALVACIGNVYSATSSYDVALAKANGSEGTRGCEKGVHDLTKIAKSSYEDAIKVLEFFRGVLASSRDLTKHYRSAAAQGVGVVGVAHSLLAEACLNLLESSINDSDNFVQMWACLGIGDIGREYGEFADRARTILQGKANKRDASSKHANKGLSKIPGGK